jgi:hypothetical protein
MTTQNLAVDSRVIVAVTTGKTPNRITTDVPGTVLAKTDDRITVKTDDAKTRTFNLETAPIRPTDVPAPADPPADTAPADVPAPPVRRGRRLSTGDVPRDVQIDKKTAYARIIADVITALAADEFDAVPLTHERLRSFILAAGNPLFGAGLVFHHSPDRFGDGGFLSDAFYRNVIRATGARPSKIAPA